jgi:hypothetical protein
LTSSAFAVIGDGEFVECDLVPARLADDDVIWAKAGDYALKGLAVEQGELERCTGLLLFLQVVRLKAIDSLG